MPIVSCAPVPLQILLQKIENPPALQKKEWNSGTHVPGAQSSKRLSKAAPLACSSTQLLKPDYDTGS